MAIKLLDYRTAEPPHTGKARSRLGAHLPGIPRLEHEIEKAQKYVAKKEARMREIRGLMLDVLSGGSSQYAKRTSGMLRAF